MASHNLNLYSSRSHCILSIKVKIKEDNQPVKVCRLELVDLAGSERAAITGSQGITRKECIQINQSLFVLRKVINSLVSKQLRKNSKKTVFIPYRDSKLTSLLKQSIGGNSYCLMVIPFSLPSVIILYR